MDRRSFLALIAAAPIAALAPLPKLLALDLVYFYHLKPTGGVSYFGYPPFVAQPRFVYTEYLAS